MIQAEPISIISSILGQENLVLSEDNVSYIYFTLSNSALDEGFREVQQLVSESDMIPADLAEEITIRIMIGLKLIKSRKDIERRLNSTSPEQKKHIHPQTQGHWDENKVFSQEGLQHGNTYQVINNTIGPTADDLDQSVCLSLTEFVDLTRDADPKNRAKALRELCPCHIRKDVEAFWNRIFEMTLDEDAHVRYQALHNLIDGSPKGREEQVIQCLDQLHRDSNPKIRAKANKVLTQYRRTGKWNE